MTPLSFEWQWQADYFIFMGLLYIALIVLGVGLIYAYVKTWFNLDNEKGTSQGQIPSRSKYTDY